MKFFNLSIIALLLGTSVNDHAAAAGSAHDGLPLEAFLSQVTTRHDGILASAQTMQSAELKPNEAQEIYSPNLVAKVTHKVDRSPLYATFGVTSMTTEDASVGVKKNFATGTNATISYDLSFNNIAGVSPQLMPQNTYYSENPSLEIHQPLWRNARGKEFAASAQIAETQSTSTIYNEKYKTKVILMDAEMAYWKLSYTREALRIQRENLARSEKLYRWAKGRVKTGLADEADEIQARAMVDLRNLDVMSAQNEEREASHNFNALRGLDSDSVPEQLTIYSPTLVDHITIPARAAQRDDIKALAASAKAAELAANLTAEKNKPSVDAFANVALNGQNPAASDIVKKSFDTKSPTWTIGLSLNMPLDKDIINAVNRGSLLDAAAADQNLKRKIFEQDQQWQNLLRKFEEARGRLKLASEIAKIQKIKLDVEKDRHQRGRSTLNQVIMFEQDYAGAELGKLSRITEVLSIYTQMKTFSSNANG